MDKPTVEYKGTFIFEIENVKYIAYRSTHTHFDSWLFVLGADDTHTSKLNANFSLMTVFDSNGKDKGTAFDPSWLKTCANRSDAKGDDVWTRTFLRTVTVNGLRGEDVERTPELESVMRELGIGILAFDSWTVEDPLNAGPFVIKDEHLWLAYRLYEDTQSAFILPVIEAGDRYGHVYIKVTPLWPLCG